MKMIKKLDILSVAKVTGVLYGGIYLIAGLAVNLAYLFLGIPALKQFDLLGFGSGILATLMLAVMVGAIAFIAGAIIAWLYNLTAKIVGGIMWQEITVNDLPMIKGHKTEPEHLFVSDKPQTEVNNVLGKNNNDTFAS
ncbi:MAG: hypothetical protein NTZ18_00735 [Candidatus Komeilibacteria bacterium]|nr:hypothetical protein [Candidatus Komeilibacteria bacterium]